MLAQNWIPFNPTEEYAYKQDGSQIPSAFVYTEKNYGDSLFIISTAAKDSSGMIIARNDSFPFFVGPEHFIGHAIKKVNQNEFQFFDIEDMVHPIIVLKTNLHLNESWLICPMNNDTATISHEGTSSIFGALDSIKVITWNQHNDTIILSKNHGIIRFSVGQKNLTLAGMHDMKLGIYPPQWQEIYDFEVGDILMIREFEISGNQMIYEYTTYTKYEVLNRVFDSTGYTYQMSTKTRVKLKKYSASGQTATVISTSYSQIPNKTYHISDTSLSFNYNSKIALSYPGEVLSFSEIINGYSMNTVYCLIELEEDQTGYYLTANSALQQVNSPNSFYSAYLLGWSWGGGGSVTAKPGLGITSVDEYGWEYHYDFELIGYRKNGVVNGNVYSESEILGIDNREIKPSISSYPNPFHTRFTVTSTNAISKLEVFTLEGKLIYSEESINNFQTEVVLDQAEDQVLLLKVSNNNGAIHYSKIIQTQH